MGSTVALVLGCRDEQAGPRPRPLAPLPPAQASVQTSDLPQALTYRSTATFGDGAIRYLGTQVEPDKARAGQPIKLSHYFKAEKTPPSGYHFFVHVIDSATGQMIGNADHEVQGGAAPLESWPIGKVIRDEHAISLPPIPGGRVQILLGFWQGDRRLAVEPARAQDGQQRAIGPTIELLSDSLPEYRVHRTRRAPAIDGDLSDPAWREAKPVELKNSLTGGPPSQRTRAWVLYDPKYLYVAFDCDDPDVWGTYFNRDDPLYTQSVVEIFIDADGDGKTYDEIEVSPTNTVFDAYFPARRQGMDLSYDSGVTSAVKVRGTLNDPTDQDQGWSVEMRIPIAKLSFVPHVPPQRGDRWRFNLYRLATLHRQQVEGQAYSPPLAPDFHFLPRFATLIFE